MVSDCDGMLYALKRHKYTKSLVDTVAKGMAAGMELDCGTVYNARNVAKALEVLKTLTNYFQFIK